MDKYLTEDKRWVSCYPTKNSSMYVEKAGYFDERPVIHTSITQLLVLLALPLLIYFSWWSIALIPLVFFGWGTLYIYLPIKTGIQDCDSAAWGFNYHSNTFWWYVGGAGNFEGGRKWKSWYAPWSMEWLRTSTLLSDNTWFNETKKFRKSWKEDTQGENYGSYDWLSKNKWKEAHSYKDAYDGTVVTATISVEEREWRPKWFMWTKLFAKTRRVIAIEFDQEVGKKKGSWKGGTIGCSYELRADETPIDCLRRMEKERKF